MEAKKANKVCPEKCSSTLCGQSQRQHNRQVFFFLFQHDLSRFQSRFYVQRIESSLEKDDIHPAVNSPSTLLLVGIIQIFISYGTISGITYIWTHRSCLISRTDRSGHEDRTIRMLCHIGIRHFPRQSSGGQIYLTYIGLHRIICHGNSVRVKRIRSEDIRSRIQILTMNRLDYIRAGDTQ